MTPPSLKDLIARAKATMVAKLGVDTPAIDALSTAIAGGIFGNYAYQDYLFKQMHPETANEDYLYLWGNRFSVDRIAAQQATGTVSFTTTTPASLPSGITLQTTEGARYTTTSAGMSDTPIACQCDVPGTAGNLAAGIKLSMTSAIAGVSPTEIAVLSMSGGSDIEDVERWRDRIVTAFNAQFMVGKRVDYSAWAMSAHADVGFAYAIDNTPALGNVTVYCGKKSADVTLSAETIAAVQSYLDNKRLAGCHVYAINATAKPIDIALSGVSDAAIRSSVENALIAMFTDKLGARDSITPSDIMLTVTSITTSFGLISPTSPTAPDTDEVLTLGAVSWQ